MPIACLRRPLGAAAHAVWCAAVLIAGLPHLETRAAEAADRPNIVLIMADDMGYSDIGCYGGEIRTPNLDQLAAGGLRFTQFYNTGRCCPTRASLLTGLYPHQAGVGHMMADQGLDGYRGDLNDRCVTIAEVLRPAGYATYMAGKWHVTKQVGHWSGDENLASRHNWPRQRGFDRFYGTIHGGGNYFNPISLVEDDQPVTSVPHGYYYTDSISDYAAQFVTEHAERRADQPFFCYVAYTSPHWPLHALDEDIAKYEGRYDAGWDALRAERHERMIAMGLIDPRWQLTQRDADVPAWKEASDKQWQARRMEVYAAQIDRMDQGIGRILAALKENDLFDNTLILFLADNGGCAEEIRPRWKGLHIPAQTHDGRPVRVGNLPEILPGSEDTYQSYGLPWANASNTPFRLYKHWVHEGGISTPLIAHWPEGINRAGDFETQPGHLIDIMATCIDLARTEYPETHADQPITPMQGVSLRPAFAGEDLARPEPIFWEHEGNRAVREMQWKLVAKGPAGPWELYDMAADRSETQDLTAERPEDVARLSAAWERWAESASVKPWPWDRPRQQN